MALRDDCIGRLLNSTKCVIRLKHTIVCNIKKCNSALTINNPMQIRNSKRNEYRKEQMLKSFMVQELQTISH